MSYKVTVITPAYNSEKTLPAALQSLREQTLGFENIEYIVGFDTSTDGTAELLHSWQNKFSNVSSVELPREKGGPGAARNAALALASAPYVMFLDADDEFTPRACETLCTVMDTRACDIAGGDFRTVECEGGHAVRATPSFLRFPEGEYDFTHGLSVASEPFISAFWCKIFRRDIIEKNNLKMRDRSLFEELMFLCRYLGFCSSGYYIKENITDYTVRPGSASRTKNLYFYVSTAETILETAELVARDGKPELVAQYLSCTDTVGEHVEWLLTDRELADDELKTAFTTWRDLLTYCAKYGVHTESFAARLLMADARAGDETALEADFFDLRRHFCERQAELDGIFSSNTWKLAKLLEKSSSWRITELLKKFV